MTLDWDPTCGVVGDYELTLTATDDATVPATTVMTVWISVTCEDPCGWSEDLAADDVDAAVLALAEFDDGTGARLYAAGNFATAGGAAASRIASWDGSSWSALGGGLDDTARALAVFDDGSGAALYAGGDFTTAGGAAATGVARWNGAAWSALGSGLPGGVNALAAFGGSLYAGGSFRTATGASADYLARWDGAAWVSVGAGVDDVVDALTVHAGTLVAGGHFLTAGGAAAARIAAWNGTTWSALGGGCDGEVRALHSHDLGGGARLYAAGDFAVAGGVAALRVAEWNGTAWSALGSGLGSGSAADRGLAVGSFGSDLVVGGTFTRTGGGVATPAIGAWDGSSWAAFGAGVGGSGASVRAVVSHANSNGLGLFAGGLFTHSGQISNATDNIARFSDTDPTILVDPIGANLCVGDPWTLEVVAHGLAPVSYQWQQDGAPIAGATAATYEIRSATLADNGDYDVVVTNPCGSITSLAVTLFVEAGPAISSQPDSLTLCEGDDADFSVTASGLGALTYQWRKDTVAIPTATSSMLSLTAVTTADAGSYDVLVTDDCGTTTSVAATLTVRVAPTITLHPQDVSVCIGDTTQLSVTAGGSAPLSYQWLKDGVPIAGANSATFDLTPTALTDSGNYAVTVSNDCGSATSTAAVVTVREAPSITAEPVGGSPCLGTSFVLSVTATGSTPLDYQWFKDGVPVSGATSATLDLSPAAVADSGSYSVTVTNDCDTATSVTVTVTVLEPPTITAQPVGGDPCLGTDLTLTVSAVGSAPLSYQWQKDSSPIAGATGSSLALTSVALSDAGSYDCVVTNSCGSATSSAAVVTIRTAPAITVEPVGGNACLGDSITLDVTATGSTPLSYQWQKNGVDIGGATGSSLTLASVTPADTANYRVVVTNNCGSAISTDATVVVDEPPTILVEPSSLARCTGGSATLSVSAAGTTPLAYQWFLDGVPIAGATSSSLTVGSVVAADGGSYTVEITNVCGAVTSTPAILTILTAPMVTVEPTSVESCLGDPATLSVTATGSSPVSYQWRRNGVAIVGETTATLSIAAVTLADDASYDVEITNSCGSTTSATATITVLTAPAIVTDPSDVIACAGDLVTLSVSASGSSPAYQWRHNGVDLAGETASTLTFASVTTGDAGLYDVVVTNVCGTATSATAELTVNVGVSITSGPADVTATAGTATTFTVVATGTLPLTYQWLLNGAPIAGATNDSLTIDPIVAADAGSYVVEVTNVCGTVPSAAATLTVDPPVAPSGITCCVTDGSVELCWTNALTYDSIEIYLDGALLTTLAGTETCYTDMPVAGLRAYQVFGSFGGLQSAAEECTVTVVPSVVGLTCTVLNPTFASPDVELTWTISSSYDSIEIRRGGTTIATLLGTDTSYVDMTPAFGSSTYDIVGIVGVPGCDTIATASCDVDVPVQSAFRRSDVNNDGNHDLADVVFILQYLFAFGPHPTCQDAADINDDGGIDISDPVYMATYLFSGGNEPQYPFMVTDTDPTDDALSCEYSIWGTP